jgi:hypothetical protein
LSAQHRAVTKLLLILALAGALADGLTSRPEPPLLIDNAQSAPPAPLDVGH